MDSKHNKQITQMKKLAFKYFQHINRIIKIMQPHLTENNKQSNYFSKFQSGSQYCSEQQLEHQFEEMKLSIQNLLRYCHNIEIENKTFKRSLSSNSQILQQNNYVIGQDQIQANKIHFFTLKSISFKENLGLKDFQCQNQELRKTRQLYLGSLKKIQQLKDEINMLNQRLNQVNHKIHEENLLNPLVNSKICFISSKNTLDSQNSLTISGQSLDFNIQSLYCHEKLDFENTSFKQNNFLYDNRDHHIVDSLIAKGIEFRQQRTLKSQEFKHLNTIVEKYREQSLGQSSQLLMKKTKSSLYR